MERNIDDVISELTKQFGEGAIATLNRKPRDVPAISTGSLLIDHALGIGGVPRGRITEIYGPDGSGKSSLCLHICAEAQKEGGLAAFIDMEHALDVKLAEAIGVNTDRLLISQPDTGSQALDIVQALIGEVDVIVVDSVAALLPAPMADAKAADNHVGLRARMMSTSLIRIKPKLGLTDTALVFTNQIRMKIGVMYGNPETTSGGMALKFYADVRMEIRRRGFLGSGDNRTGQTCRVRAVKNKCAPPFRTAEIDLIYGQGISRAAEVLDLGVEEGIMDKRGAYYYYREENVAHGREKAKEWIAQHPEIERAVRATVFGTPKEKNNLKSPPEDIDERNFQSQFDVGT